MEHLTEVVVALVGVVAGVVVPAVLPPVLRAVAGACEYVASATGAPQSSRRRKPTRRSARPRSTR